MRPRHSSPCALKRLPTIQLHRGPDMFKNQAADRLSLPCLQLLRLHVLASIIVLTATLGRAQVIVPGTGQKLAKVGDDFEDPKWSYVFNLPKSSEEDDGQVRRPGGVSKNGRWFEGAKRGQPDVLKRVPTPEGGLEGSQGALLMRSQQTGVPGMYSGHFKQDDLIIDSISRLGGSITPSRSPSCVVRVYLPPWDQWERRNGPTFGVRAGCKAYETKTTGGRWRRSTTTSLEPYWPGFFVHFVPGVGKDKAGKPNKDFAFVTIRAGYRGNDLQGPKITEPGWWTFGMSFSPSGQVHYFCHAGVADLTMADHVTSQNPYGSNCQQFDTMFFNVVSGDNGSWSTPWIIDDPTLYVDGQTQVAVRSAAQR